MTPWPLGLDWVSGVVIAFAITPGGHVALALLLERRIIRPRAEFTALAYGDPLLCVACGIGFALTPDGLPRAVAFLGTAAAVVVSCAVWLGFGLWQWVDELRRGYYTAAQAFSPTKVWHQLVVYPIFGTLVGFAGLAGLAAPITGVASVLGKVAIGGALAAWVLMNVHDRSHPRLGHPPYDWRRLRPSPRPWPRTSTTLRTPYEVSHSDRPDDAG
ncbi:hypothetical protein [Actinokineospora globicatena]|uniref:hypothetical protein n=1 Tax=Actinokineospora globicatena TaxID=103729 RepID=UPI0020A4F885|nr:hypothetical protein [Actinokineospora globicatena]MCP2304157.1 hypothetical protein [Actinokineospora globicatena]GLW78486.1 hypothetical protein Aglo01_29680 [Actinokineospora globicatena]GLW84850.1 hypothetical protein Aglo02_24900 [Actinokineospora globicatena]